MNIDRSCPKKDVDIYIDSLNLPSYKFFLKITKPDVAQHLEKLKLHAKGVFEREFWEDLSIGTTFPILKKISLHGNSHFSPFNLKFFKNTNLQTLDLSFTKVDELEYIQPFLEKNIRVLIGNKKHHDTLLMALSRVESNQDYSFFKLAITTGSWRKKNEGEIIEFMLKITQQNLHWDAMQKCVEELILPEKISEPMQKTLNIIKHPHITFKGKEMDQTHSEMKISYAFALSMPPLHAIINGGMGEAHGNSIQLQISKDALDAIEQWSGSGDLPEGMTVDTILELAKFADMHIWPQMERDLIEYIRQNQQNLCKEINGMYDETKEYKLIETMDIFLTEFLINIPDAIKRPFIEIGIKNITKYVALRNNNSLSFTLKDPHFQEIQLNYNFEFNFLTLSLPLDFLDLSGIGYLQDLPPLESISRLYLIKTKTEFPTEFLIYKFKQIANIFPKVKEIDMSNFSHKYDVDCLAKSMESFTELSSIEHSYSENSDEDYKFIEVLEELEHKRNIRKSSKIEF